MSDSYELAILIVVAVILLALLVWLVLWWNKSPVKPEAETAEVEHKFMTDPHLFQRPRTDGKND